MSKPSHLPTSLKLFYSLHLVLTLSSIGGISYLVFSLHQTQNELNNLKESCAFCDLQNLVKFKDDISKSNFKSIFAKDDTEKKLESGANEKRGRREVGSNQTCTKVIRDLTTLLEVTNKLVCII
jgi:hypothetical protein